MVVTETEVDGFDAYPVEFVTEITTLYVVASYFNLLIIKGLVILEVV